MIISDKEDKDMKAPTPKKRLDQAKAFYEKLHKGVGICS